MKAFMSSDQIMNRLEMDEELSVYGKNNLFMNVIFKKNVYVFGNQNRFFGCKFLSFDTGMILYGNENKIEESYFSDSLYGLSLYGDKNKISKNLFSKNEVTSIIGIGKDNMIEWNQFFENKKPISIDKGNLVIFNLFRGNQEEFKTNGNANYLLKKR